MTNIELTDEDALLFIQFQKNYSVIAPIVGYMSSLQIIDIKNTQIVLDIDQAGKVSHMAITKHFR